MTSSDDSAGEATAAAVTTDCGEGAASPQVAGCCEAVVMDLRGWTTKRRWGSAIVGVERGCRRGARMPSVVKRLCSPVDYDMKRANSLCRDGSIARTRVCHGYCDQLREAR